MKETTRELIKKFEQDYETDWAVYARVTRNLSEGHSPPHHGIKYVSGPNEDSNVLVLRNPFISYAYSAESWGPMATIDDFAKNALAQILADKDAADQGREEGCGISCG